MSCKRREMSADRKRVLNPFGGRKKRIPPNKKQRTVMTKEKRQNLTDMDRGSYYNQEEWLKEFLEDKGIFYNDDDSESETYDNESSSDGDDEKEKVCESLNNNRLKIVPPLLLQELINDFAVCKHCGEKILLWEDMVGSHGFGRMWKFECETDSCESDKLAYTPIKPKRSYFFEINRAAVLAFCLIGKGHSGAKKVVIILNIDN